MSLSVTIKESESIQITRTVSYDFSALREAQGWQHVADDIWEFFLNSYLVAFSKNHGDKESAHLEITQDGQQLSLQVQATDVKIIETIKHDFLNDLMLLAHHYFDDFSFSVVTDSHLSSFIKTYRTELKQLELDELQLAQTFQWEYLLNEESGYFRQIFNSNSYPGLLNYLKVNASLPELTEEQQNVSKTSFSHKI